MMLKRLTRLPQRSSPPRHTHLHTQITNTCIKMSLEMQTHIRAHNSLGQRWNLHVSSNSHSTHDLDFSVQLWWQYCLPAMWRQRNIHYIQLLCVGDYIVDGPLIYCMLHIEPHLEIADVKRRCEWGWIKGRSRLCWEDDTTLQIAICIYNI